MYDAMNGTLLPTPGVSSPYITFGVTPGMGIPGNVMPPVPYGPGIGAYGQAGMFPGAMGMGMMGDTFSSQASALPLKSEYGGHGEHNSTMSSIGKFLITAGKIAIAGAAIFLGVKGAKAIWNKLGSKGASEAAKKAK